MQTWALFLSFNLENEFPCHHMATYVFQIPVCIILFQQSWGPSKTLQATLEWTVGDLIIVQSGGARTDCGSHTTSSSSDPLHRSHCSQRWLVFPGLQYIALCLIPGLGSEGVIMITGLVWQMAKQKWLQFMVWFCWRGLFFSDSEPPAFFYNSSPCLYRTLSPPIMCY